MNELIKTLVSMLCFLLATYSVIPAYRAAWSESRRVETITYKQNFWKRIPDAPQDYAGPMVYTVDCPEGKRLVDALDGKSTPAGWQAGWRWNGYIVETKTTKCDFDVIYKPSTDCNLLGLPKTYDKKYIQKTKNCVWSSIEK